MADHPVGHGELGDRVHANRTEPIEVVGMGRLAGVPVRLHVSVIVGALFAVYIGSRASGDHDYSGYGLLAALVWFGSLIVHQMGHLIAAGRIGAHVDRIVIGLLGDLAPATVPHEPRREMVVAEEPLQEPSQLVPPLSLS